MAVGVARRSPLPGSNCHAARAHPGKRKETADASIKLNDISFFLVTSTVKIKSAQKKGPYCCFYTFEAVNYVQSHQPLQQRSISHLLFHALVYIISHVYSLPSFVLLCCS